MVAYGTSKAILVDCRKVNLPRGLVCLWHKQVGKEILVWKFKLVLLLLISENFVELYFQEYFYIICLPFHIVDYVASGRCVWLC